MNAQLSVSEIVKRAADLERKEFENLFKKLSDLRLQKNGITVLKDEEASLLAAINKGFSTEKLERLHYLDWKLEFSALTDIEATESLVLAEAYESYSTDRLKYLSQLATLRKVSIDALMEQLGFITPIHG